MTLRLRKSSIALPLLCLMLGAPLALRAQSDDGPPKVLLIQREYTKPGKSGAPHEKAEAAFIAAFKPHDGPVHYFGMNSLSGPDRALFFTGYPSFAAWESDTKAIEHDVTLSAAVDHAAVADGDLLSATDQSLWTRNDEMSYNTHNLLGVRYLELQVFQVKPGHEKDWSDLAKMVKEGYKKGLPEASWVMYEQAYGLLGTEFLVITSLKSMAEIDSHFAQGHKFVEAMGEKGMKQLSELAAAAIESQQTNLFAINPKISFPPKPLIDSEPDFWKPKMPMPAKKSDPKPAQ